MAKSPYWLALANPQLARRTRLIAQPPHRVRLATADLLAAVKQVRAFTNGGGSGIIRLKAERGTLEVSARVDEDAVEVKVPAQGVCKVAVQDRYLLDLLAHSGETLVFQSGLPSEPVRINVGKTIYMQMPMFVQW